MNPENSNRAAQGSGDLDDALSILEGLDYRRNLGAAPSIFTFFASCSFAVLSFFIIYDLLLWEGVKETVAHFLIAISWILIFPIWILAFLLTMWLLDAAGIKDLQTIARHRLSELALGTADLRELINALADGTWKHHRIFQDAVADLAREPPRRGGNSP